MRQLGNLGEDAAAKFLKKQGYKIIGRNFSTQMGEIDILAQDGEYLVFVEVKLRKAEDHGTPAEFVNYHKQQRLRKTAAFYLQQHDPNAFARFDVVEIVGYEKGSKLKIERIGVIKNAF